jgi:hypothetical protein
METKSCDKFKSISTSLDNLLEYTIIFIGRCGEQRLGDSDNTKHSNDRRSGIERKGYGDHSAE